MLYEEGKLIQVEAPYLLDNQEYDIDLSLVVPAYNEEARLPTMMKETVDYLNIKLKEGKLFKKAELVIVNDGSRDKTMT